VPEPYPDERTANEAIRAVSAALRDGHPEAWDDLSKAVVRFALAVEAQLGASSAEADLWRWRERHAVIAWAIAATGVEEALAEYASWAGATPPRDASH
jgi:hypothetical protein